MPKQFKDLNLSAIKKLASQVALAAQKGDVVFLSGQLGAGKTTFVRAFLQALGHLGSVKSPTYTLVETYSLSSALVHHFDLYRLSSPSELIEIGLEDYLSSKAICLFEWPEIALKVLPEPTLALSFDIINENHRNVTLL